MKNWVTNIISVVFIVWILVLTFEALRRYLDVEQIQTEFLVLIFLFQAIAVFFTLRIIIRRKRIF